MRRTQGFGQIIGMLCLCQEDTSCCKSSTVVDLWDSATHWHNFREDRERLWDCLWTSLHAGMCVGLCQECHVEPNGSFSFQGERVWRDMSLLAGRESENRAVAVAAFTLHPWTWGWTEKVTEWSWCRNRTPGRDDTWVYLLDKDANANRMTIFSQLFSPQPVQFVCGAECAHWDASVAGQNWSKSWVERVRDSLNKKVKEIKLEWWRT